MIQEKAMISSKQKGEPEEAQRPLGQLVPLTSHGEHRRCGRAGAMSGLGLSSASAMNG